MNMCNRVELFSDVKLSVVNWVASKKDAFMRNNIVVEQEQKEDSYIVNFQSDYAMGQIVVCQPYCAPYHFVCFEVGLFANNSREMDYTFLDDDNSSIEDIIKGLNKGFAIIESGRD